MSGESRARTGRLASERVLRSARGPWPASRSLRAGSRCDGRSHAPRCRPSEAVQVLTSRGTTPPSHATSPCRSSRWRRYCPKDHTARRTLPLKPEVLPGQTRRRCRASSAAWNSPPQYIGPIKTRALQLYSPQAQRVGDDRYRAEGHGALAMTGLSSRPNAGYNIPAAIGTPSTL